MAVNPDTVTTNLDDGSAGSLREVLANANAGDTITFAAGFYDGSISDDIQLASTLEITKNVTIEGLQQGGSTTPVITIDGQNLYTDFTIDASVTAARLDGLVIENGNGTLSAPPTPKGAGGATAGAIYTSGTVFLTNSDIKNNTSTGGTGGQGFKGGGGSPGGAAAGGIYVASGGALHFAASDVFSGNSANGGSGGQGSSSYVYTANKGGGGSGFVPGPYSGGAGGGGGQASGAQTYGMGQTGSPGGGTYGGGGGGAGSSGNSTSYGTTSPQSKGAGGGGGGGNAFENYGGNGTISEDAVSCFGTGTLIRTARGEIAVEALAIGDMVVTAAGRHRPVKWIGHRHVDCRKHPRPETVWPYRVQAGAFGPGLPHADLWLSPDHCLAVRVMDDVFMTAATLDNGCTIAQVPRDTVTYWHVELDTHDVILANGLPAESYLESGNRHAFDNGGGALSLHPSFGLGSKAGYCLPTIDEGVVITAVRQRLEAQAEALGWALAEQDADVHLLADGVAIRAERDGTRLSFQVPAGVRSLTLQSASFVPRQHGPEAGADRRRLGIAVRSLAIADQDGTVQEIALDHPALGPGFHLAEGQAPAAHRWTDGAARLGADLWADHPAGFTLEVLAAGQWVRNWSAPKGMSLAAVV